MKLALGRENNYYLTGPEQQWIRRGFSGLEIRTQLGKKSKQLGEGRMVSCEEFRVGADAFLSRMWKPKTLSLPAGILCFLLDVDDLVAQLLFQRQNYGP